MIEVKRGAELAASFEPALTNLQDQVVAALRTADSASLYDVAAHLDAAHQLIIEHMRQQGLASSIIEVLPPLDVLA